jgi:capsular polysaccharide transport system permease protein
MFLREAVARVARDRIAWVWLLVEPIFHVVLVMYMFSVIRQRVVVGADPAVFIMLGVVAFLIPRNIMNRCRNVVRQNRALYTYRQVLPVDAVLVRAAVAAFLQCLVLIVVTTLTGSLGHDVVPVNPLLAMAAVGGMMLMGLGLGLVISVVAELVPNVARVMRLAMTPLYFVSAVLYPSMLPPPALRDVLLLNPLVHGIESLRIAFMPQYQVPAGIDLGYLVAWAVSLVFLGLALHVRYQKALLAYD